jgi:hypothetical protein
MWGALKHFLLDREVLSLKIYRTIMQEIKIRMKY